ncbi:hypothetical protein [Paeniglutamicibacter cryotolerans]|uniref:Uncharacterized protein n=1 Tax=Paeniglutamicibacter cryotolerans TaxID=670079 RepID=A0A839QVR9_9MICC|nr:hypothetical protein [Paeniglutamicibacter cryotolerans]MBB2997392.1 hypothetical protein [Paeniglutamicibacter cryotolerans]
MASNPVPPADPRTEQVPGQLSAELIFIFEAEPATATALLRGALSARGVLALLAAPAVLDGPCAVEVQIPVTDTGLILICDGTGDLLPGQQVEDFAIALKRSTGALHVDFDGADVESGEPISDERLETLIGGRSLLIGDFSAAELALADGSTGDTWSCFEQDGKSIAVTGRFLAADVFFETRRTSKVMMLSRCGDSYALAHWVREGRRGALGDARVAQFWPVAMTRVAEPPAGSAAADCYALVDTQRITLDPQELEEFGSIEPLAPLLPAYTDALAGIGSMEAMRAVLIANGLDPALAGLLEADEPPAEARTVPAIGYGHPLAEAYIQSQAMASGVGRIWAPGGWPVAVQLLWGLFEALLAFSWFFPAEGPDALFPRWVDFAVGVLWSADAVHNLVAGSWRAVRRVRARLLTRG